MKAEHQDRVKMKGLMVEKENVNCPYCGTLICNEVEQCPNCKSWFKEPELVGFHLRSIYMYLCCDIFLNAFGFCFVYPLIWNVLNFKQIKHLASQKDFGKYKGFLFAFGILTLLTFLLKLFIIPAVIVEICLAYRILRIIEKYSNEKYHSPITHHELGMIVFSMLYVVYFMDTYSQRIHDPNARYHFNFHRWLNYILVGIILGIILYIMGVFSAFTLNF